MFQGDATRPRAEAGADATRRRLLGMAAAAPLAAGLGLPAMAQAAAGDRAIAGYDAKNVPSVATLGGWLKQLHDFGPVRDTGTSNCRAFEEWLATQFGNLGCTIERDQFRLTSWECDLHKECEIVVTEDGGRRKTLDVVAFYPFAASTRGKAPVSGRVLFAPGKGMEAARDFAEKADRATLAKSIVVLDLPVTFAYRDAYRMYPEVFPESPISMIGAPSAHKQSVRGLIGLFQDKCLGLICCYTDVSKEAARYNILPFSEPHGKISALWVGAEDASYLQSVSGKANVSIRCDARLTPNSRADSFIATLKGQTDEVIFLTTHTDGPNEVNDNGALGLLAVAQYAARMSAAKRRRTLVFSLPTGHYAIGAISDPVTGSGRRPGTAGVMEKWPDVLKRTVAQLHLEQLAATEWLDIDGQYRPTGKPAGEFWIPTPKTQAVMRKMFMATTRGEDPKYSRLGLVESGTAGGEGGGLRSMGIPGIGLMGAPTFFFRADPKGVLDKLDPRILRNQVAMASKMYVMMDRFSVAQLNGQAPITDADMSG